jgi:hypothetical protein
MILRVSDPDTQKWAQSLFGGQEKFEESYSKNSSLLGGKASFGESESVRERSLVLTSEFSSLHLASKEKGISGFAKCPSIGSFKVNIPGRIVDTISRPDTSTPDFVERDDSELYLMPYSDEEKAFYFGVEEKDDDDDDEVVAVMKVRKELPRIKKKRGNKYNESLDRLQQVVSSMKN